MARLIDDSFLEDRCKRQKSDEWNKKVAPSSWADAYEQFLTDIENCPTVDAVPVCVLKEILMRYFDIGDSYHFELTRVKEAFEVGTMSLDDFQEWTEENVDDLADYIKKNCADGERKGGDE